MSISKGGVDAKAEFGPLVLTPNTGLDVNVNGYGSLLDFPVDPKVTLVGKVSTQRCIKRSWTYCFGGGGGPGGGGVSGGSQGTK